jgi:energy-coupling factor transporter ATP-binding protein EcfA2
MSLNISYQTAEECLRISHILQGHYHALVSEKDTVIKKVEKAKKWLGLQPEYLKFLQHLQSLLHQKNIGAFSELLTYFVKDVLKKDKDIVFDLYTYHNLPALKIEALNDGCRESIYEGNGGSIANIVSTGLRLIALSRLQHRKFIVLDEPDCWLKPDHVPIFAKIIGEISEKLKIQTIIISHHDWKYFKDYGRVIELSSDGKNLEANMVHDTEFEDNEDDDYIRSIRLRQFMSHQDTEFNLHPYLTCLIGENDIGKSVLATAIKAVSYNDSSDSYVKHHCDEAQVLFTLNKKRQILWQRFKVTSHENPQKVKYSLFVDKNLITEEFNSSDVPKFISKELNILTTEDLDIHVGNQKQPVFLLSSDVKPQERAKILSLGKESLIIQKMMENIKVKTRQNKQTVKEGEEKYDTLNKQLQVLVNIDDIVKTAEEAKSAYFALNKQQESIVELNSTVNELVAIKSLSEIKTCITHIYEPSLKDCSTLERTLQDLYVQESIAEIEEVQHNIKEPELKLVNDLDKMIKRLSLVEAGASIELIDIDLDEPKIKDVAELADVLGRLKNSTSLSKVEPIDINLNEPKIKDVAELADILSKLKNSNKLSEIEPVDYQIAQEVKLKDSESLKKMLIDLEESEVLLEDYEVKKANLELWKEKIDQEISAFLEKNKGICPTCHQELGKEHFVGDKHAEV